MAVVCRPAFSSRTTPTKRQRAPSEERASASREATSMGEDVRYIESSSTRDGREERNLVTAMEDGVGRRVLAVDRGRRGAGKPREERDLRGELPPERGDVGALGKLPLLLVAAGGVTERREIE